jgi:dTDP-4-amino-4,6-dideoxygalactose transaminase
LPAHTLYRNLGYKDAGLTNAHRLAGEVLSLPVHPQLTETDLQQIVDAVNAWAETRPLEAGPLAIEAG